MRKKIEKVIDKNLAQIHADIRENRLRMEVVVESKTVPKKIQPTGQR